MQAKVEKLCIGLVFLYHLLYSTAFFETIGIFLNPVRARAISLGLILLLAFLIYSPTKNKLLKGSYKGFGLLGTLVTTVYLVFGYDIFKYRIGSAVGYEVILGILAIAFVLESTRFTTGKEISIIAIALIFYTLFGHYLWGFFQAPPASMTLVSGQTYLGLMGIYGVPTGIILDYVFGFMVFGYIFQAVGGMHLFTQIALRVFGKSRGGSAKVAVATNCFFGMVSGSTLAAVLVTGPLTIPQMRKEGYSERYMGGLIAAAADAAQLMPPVMGIVAFFMAEYLRVPYIKVAIAAFAPGFFYYFSLFVSCHIEAIREGIRPLPPSEGQIPPLWKLLVKHWHCIAVSAFLIVMMVTQMTTIRQALMISTALLLVTGSLQKDTRPTFKALRDAVVDTARGMVSIAPVCATAGIIIACFSMTALDYKFSAEITDIAGKNLILLLFLASIACFILGMGMPTLPAYILVVMLVGPTLLSMGILPMVVHMFIFYQSLAAMLTPPVCLNVYAVAPMVNSTIWPIGISATVIGAARYVIPFFFVYRPGLLMIGNAMDIVVDTFLCFIVIVAISFTQNRYGLTNAKWLEIFAGLIGALLLFYPFGGLPIASGAVGAALVAFAVVSQLVRFYKLRSSHI